MSADGGIAGAGLIASVVAGGVALTLKAAEKLLEKYRPKREIEREVGTDYQKQIVFLNAQIDELAADVDALRKEIRGMSKREHLLHRMIHKHCMDSPACAAWFDHELSKAE